MCNINVWIKKKGVDITHNVECATAHSYTRNSDGDGVYFSGSGGVVKSVSKINFIPYREEIEDSELVITHQRLATSGKSPEYIHPFVDDRFVLVHNGIFSKTEGEHSDTYIFFEAFSKAYNECSDIKTSIEKAVKEVEGGSFSVFIYDKIADEAYYFKSYLTNIEVKQTVKGMFFITTENDNVKFLEDDVKWFWEIKAEHLYNFHKDKKGEWNIFNLGKMEIPSAAVSIYGGTGWKGGYGYEDYEFDKTEKQTKERASRYGYDIVDGHWVLKKKKKKGSTKEKEDEEVDVAINKVLESDKELEEKMRQEMNLEQMRQDMYY